MAKQNRVKRNRVPFEGLKRELDPEIQVWQLQGLIPTGYEIYRNGDWWDEYYPADYEYGKPYEGVLMRR